MTIEDKEVWVFDNKGETADQYSIVTEDGNVLSASFNPFYPTGIGMYSFSIPDKEKDWPGGVKEYVEHARMDSKWLGDEVTDIGELPEDVVKFIKQSI